MYEYFIIPSQCESVFPVLYISINYCIPIPKYVTLKQMFIL